MRRKTAYLFGGCAQIGGMLGKVPAEQEQALKEYGFNLGMAFQLVDDLLDFTGDTAAVGKPIASDLREGKVTLPLIHLQEHANDGSGPQIIRDVIAARNATPEQWHELLQLERIGKIAITEADYFELIDRKTASLFSACARLGAISAGADELVETQLADYAWNLGIAFQLVDDILDFTSREKILGKPVGNDLREGKVTLPLIYALEAADPEERKLVETVLTDGNYDQVPFSKILNILHRHQGIERAQERAQAFTEKARAIIGEFPASPYQRALTAVTDLVTARDH